MGKNPSGGKQTLRANTTRDKEDPAANKDEYSIGHGKPPKQTQFKTGDGRVRPGRPKGSKNIATLVLDAARDQVTVAIDGKKRRISKAQAAAIHLANAGATGNEKLLLKFIDLIAGIEARAEAARPSDYPFNDTDKTVIEEIYRRLRPYDERGSD
ncbi:DUF5681 domain-containing protein [Nitrobacter sp. NHB1]|uniref:DUF5681 domain-containing protein n=1 Tax=Nitrobacter sp. NHB1 TaxID=3119830 RepID=UPI002FFEB274